MQPPSAVDHGYMSFHRSADRQHDLISEHHWLIDHGFKSLPRYCRGTRQPLL
jgi:hypothetical protein